ncbi:hypothetical protein OPV22_007416 [Ensete ventricosum]|uniref:E3 ubiquitin-protein ligase WAV3-like C-terminal domain-containing protein n=1 Tax=Ensete ventricosum TaxID=4639 RepID=A0AAV8RH83_ENSVE|nr:hypothetical protein OPV22_007416 [Ensete ventricosum]
MGGWRRAFCTSVGGETEATVVARTEAGEKKQQKQLMGSSSPRSCAKLSFFSGAGAGGGRGGNSPSTQRLALCRTSSESPDGSKLQCDKLTGPATASRKNRSPALFRRKALSTPSSPRSPSGFALFNQLSRSRCRICSQSLRTRREGQRAARLIVERLVVAGGGGAPSGEEIVADAVRKATKVLEDRRERNPVATIMLLSDARPQQLQDQGKKDEHEYHHTPLCSPRDAGDGDIRPHPLPMTTSASPATSYAHLAIPLHDPGFGDGAAGPSTRKQKQESSADDFMKCVGGLVSLVMRDVRLQLFIPSCKIPAVYPCGGGGGGGGCCREVAPGEGSFVLHLGNLYAEEERKLLVEVRVPVSSSAASSPENSHHQLSVKCYSRDPAIQGVILDAEQILLLPPLLHSHPELSQAASSSSSSATSQWLRNLFVSTRALAESRRLADLSDYATAHHLLSSARSLLRQSACDGQYHGLIQNLEAELADLERRRLLRKQHQLPRHQEQQEESLSPSNRRRQRRESPAEVRGEQLTSTSAWRAAEQLAKVAIMRKSLNRVGDLHGFENARF